jgi:hypothetical protein
MKATGGKMSVHNTKNKKQKIHPDLPLLENYFFPAS